MRFPTAAATVCLGLLTCFAVYAADPPAAAPAPGATATPPTSPPGDAAAKHAKRTACLKEAKTQKLVGTAKTSFIKNCIAAP